MKSIVMVLLATLTLTACATAPQDRFEAMMIASREGRDAQTMTLATQLLADPNVASLTKARTEMTVALVHIRAKHWPQARAALDRAIALGIDLDTGYFRDHLAEYESWIQGTH